MRGKTQSGWIPARGVATLAVLLTAGLLLFGEGKATKPQTGVATGSQIFIDPSKAGQEIPTRPVIDTHEGLRQELLPNGLYIVRGNFLQTLKVKIGPDGGARFFHTTEPPSTPSVEGNGKTRGVDSDEETTSSGSKEKSG